MTGNDDHGRRPPSGAAPAWPPGAQPQYDPEYDRRGHDPARPQQAPHAPPQGQQSRGAAPDDYSRAPNYPEGYPDGYGQPAPHPAGQHPANAADPRDRVTAPAPGYHYDDYVPTTGQPYPPAAGAPELASYQPHVPPGQSAYPQGQSAFPQGQSAYPQGQQSAHPQGQQSANRPGQSPYAPQFEAYVPPTAPPRQAASAPPRYDPRTGPPYAPHGQPAARDDGRGYSDTAHDYSDDPRFDPRNAAHYEQHADPNSAVGSGTYDAPGAAHAEAARYTAPEADYYGFATSAEYRADQQDTAATGQQHPSAFGYDVGGFGAPAAPQRSPEPALPQTYAGHAEPGYHHGSADMAGAYSSDGSQPPRAAPDYAPPQYADPALNPVAVQSDTMAIAPVGGGDLDAQHYGADDGYEEDYEEAPRSGRRLMMMAGALVGAVVVGGGLAYGFKSMMGPSDAKIAGTPIVRDGGQPSKIAAGGSGGSLSAEQEAKIMGRLGNGADSDPRTASDGSRRVPTLTIGRDGTVRSSAASAGAGSAGSIPFPGAQAPQEETISVPGLTVVDAFTGRPITANAAGATASINRPTPQAQAPRVISRAEEPLVVRPPPSEAPPQRAAPSRPVVIARATPDPEPKPPARLGASAPVAAPAASDGSNGYVAVLASVPVSSSSKVNALSQFANLQQKYSGVLSGKTPDVREADLGSKGRYHRLLVGPPGSMRSASGVCSGLKEQGYSGCWVLAY